MNSQENQLHAQANSNSSQLVHHQVAHQSLIHPFSNVIQNEKRTVTRVDLEHQSNMIAIWLLDKGLKPRSRVIILLPPGIEFLLAAYGVMKIGAVFVPANPYDPSERIKHVLEVTEADCVIFDSKSEFARSIHTPAQVMAADKVLASPKDISSEDEAWIQSAGKSIDPQDSAYIMFTSGTTGKPKAVLLSHLALSNLLKWQSDVLNLDASDVFLQRSPPTFDFSISEFWLPLTAGCVLAIPGSDIRSSPLEISKFMQRHGVTVAQFVPLFNRAWLAEIERNPDIKPMDLRNVVSNGERLPDTTRKMFYEIFGSDDVNLFNQYGPAECTVAVTNLKTSKSSAETEVTIGKPAPNCRVYILDENLNPVLGGEIGELCIGGNQVGLGYIGASPKENEKFIFSRSVGERIYRTGDLAQQLDRGELKLLGRADRQIKIAGHRIEPAEIERVIESCNLVTGVIVTGRERKSSEDYSKSYLAAYVTPKHVDIKAIRDALRESLPSYMRPQIIVSLDAFPVSANGKENLPAADVTEYLGFTPEGDSREGYTFQEMLLIDILIEKFHISANTDSEWDTLGLDSLDLVEIELAIEDKGYRFKVQMADFVRSRITISGIAKLMTQQKTTVKNVDCKIDMSFQECFEWATDQYPDEKIVLVHSSMPDLLRCYQRIELRNEIVGAVRGIVGEGYTIVAPSFTPSFCETGKFDIKQSKSESGTLSDWLYEDIEDSVRTRHPIYSYVTVGPKSAELMKTTLDSPFGSGSASEWFEDNNALILTIGTLDITQSHRVEYLVGAPHHNYIKTSGIADYGSGPQRVTTNVYRREIDHYKVGSVFAQDTNTTNRMLSGHISRAQMSEGIKLGCISSKEIVKALFKNLRNDPLCLLKNPADVKTILERDHVK